MKKMIDRLDKEIKQFEEDYIRFDVNEKAVQDAQKTLDRDPHQNAFVILYVDYVLRILKRMRDGKD